MEVEELDRLVGAAEAKRVRGCRSDSTLWNDIKVGLFPPPDRVISDIRYWRFSTLQRWVNSPDDATHA